MFLKWTWRKDGIEPEGVGTEEMPAPKVKGKLDSKDEGIGGHGGWMSARLNRGRWGGRNPASPVGRKSPTSAGVPGSRADLPDLGWGGHRRSGPAHTAAPVDR